MLKAVQRLLRQHAYEPILFSSAAGFQKPHRYRRGGLRHPRHQPAGRIRDRAETWSQRRRHFRAGHLHDRQCDPTVREAALASGCMAFLTKPFSAQIAHRAAQERIGRAFIGSDASVSTTAKTTATASRRRQKHRLERCRRTRRDAR